MAFTRDSVPDLSGKVAVVTGANGGLGLETASVFAAKGAQVVMAARDAEKAARAAQRITSETPDASLEMVPLDLASLESVRTAAEKILAGHDHIDILVNNAGLMAMPERRTADGFEMQLGVNHLGHWAFTAHLMPAIVAADACRVVTVTSTAHHMGRSLDPDNPHLEGRYKPWRAYGQSKLANYDFALGLQREFEQAGVTAESLLAHPGFSNTDLQARTAAEGGGGWLGSMSHRSAGWFAMSAAEGALPQIRAATDPEAQGGEFYAPRFIGFGPAVRRPFLRPGRGGAIDTLWRVSERETGVALEIRR